MKKAIIITIALTLVIASLAYYIFFHEKSIYVAGEYRYYTTYEKYMSKDKIVGISTKSYDDDKYNLKRIRDEIKYQINILDFYRKNIIHYIDSINLDENTISDYDRYIKSLDLLKTDIYDQKSTIGNYRSDLIELNEYISDIEREKSSIIMYEFDIYHLCDVIKSIDSTTTDYSLFIDNMIHTATSNTYVVAKNIIKEREKERKELLEETESERQLEKQFNINFSKENYNNTYDYSINYYPRVPNYNNLNIPSYHSTYTNSNHVKVEGYYKSNGTYVKPHMRTAPNNTIMDNFSTSPNINPYTGEKGKVKY